MKNIFAFVIFVSLNLAQNQLPTGSTDLFSGSGNCESCHTGSGSVLTFNGVDVSPVTHWRSSMMANSSKDPFWRAEVSEEVAEFPQMQQLIESTCTKCHSPIGYTEAIFNGSTAYSMEELKSDPLADDGVSCTLCHQVQPGNMGASSSYSGGYEIQNIDELYGPYQNPFTMPMINFVGYTPVYSPHVNESELCATCHTLFTPYVDNNGQIAGTFPEQTPYIEWKNSIYPDAGIECQSCHMPQISEPIDISQLPPWHSEQRTPFWQHKFAGANQFIVELIKSNIDSIGATASEQNFDSTLSFIENSLMREAVELELSAEFTGDSVEVRVLVSNLSGHKIPTGIPFRRMWIHLKTVDKENNIIFESGNWNEHGEIYGLNENYEPHHNKIINEDEVQIYEAIMKNVDDEVTYTLLRAKSFHKDNRIPPKGFLSTNPSYDTTAVYGFAVSDENFNKSVDGEGTGSDLVIYKFPAIENKSYTISAEVCYQTLTPRLAEHIGEFDTPDINSFIEMYHQQDKSPVIMKISETTIDIPTSTETESNKMGFRLEQNYPNPFNPATVIYFSLPLDFIGKTELSVYDLLGKRIAVLIDDTIAPGSYEVKFDGKNLPSGIYLYRLKTANYSDTKKMALIR